MPDVTDISDTSKWWPTAELCRRAGITQSGLRSLRYRGYDIPPIYKFGRGTYVPVAEAEAWLARRLRRVGE